MDDTPLTDGEAVAFIRLFKTELEGWLPADYSIAGVTLQAHEDRLDCALSLKHNSGQTFVLSATADLGEIREDAEMAASICADTVQAEYSESAMPGAPSTIPPFSRS